MQYKRDLQGLEKVSSLPLFHSFSIQFIFIKLPESHFKVKINNRQEDRGQTNVLLIPPYRLCLNLGFLHYSQKQKHNRNEKQNAGNYYRANSTDCQKQKKKKRKKVPGKIPFLSRFLLLLVCIVSMSEIRQLKA